MWNEIKNKNDIEFLYKKYDSLHDSCIKEFKYISGAYIDNEGMNPINDKRILRMVIQGYCSIDYMIEFEFSGLKYLKLYPITEEFTCEISNITIFFENDYIIWCDNGDITIDELSDYEGTLICSSNIRWRQINKYYGSNEVYIST